MNTLTEAQIRRIHCLYYGCDAILNEKADLLDKASMNPQLKEWVKERYSTEQVFKMEDIAVGMYGVEFVKLILKPLSAISDADAIDIAKMYGGVRCHIDDGFIQVIDKDNYVPKYLLFSVDFPNQFSQFLIQRGYAVPLFIEPGHPDNGKTAIELGLAIAKTE